MEEDIKSQIEPITNGVSGVLRDEKGRIMPGSAPLNPDGRGLETISITTEQKKFFKENPEEFKKFCEEIRKDSSMRKIVWNYIDGMPTLKIGGDKENPLYFKDLNNDELNTRIKEVEGRILAIEGGEVGKDSQE